MSFLTRKPENAPTPASGSGPVPGAGAGTGAASVSDAGSVSGTGSAGGSMQHRESGAKTSLSDLYEALIGSQKQLAEYLLARESELRSAAAFSASGEGNSAGVSGNAAGTNASGAPAAASARPDMRMFAEQLRPLTDTLNMLGQYIDGQMMPAISSRFDALEALLRALPAASAVSAASVPSAASASGAGLSADSVQDSASAAGGPSAQNNAQESVSSEYADVSAQSVSPSSADSVGSAVSKPVSARQSADLAQLDKAVFGEMALEPSIQNERQYILQGILAHDAVCSYLGGILMMFQSSAPDKMVLLLKDLGEAFYRWVNSMPENNFEQFEDVLARWAQWLCESAGLPNHIETVMPGQRFDAARHNSVSRGVTVTQIHGWVVLRGNGSVYSKALVDVQ